MMHHYALRSESLFMAVEMNPRLSREQIEKIVREYIDPIDDQKEDYLASVTHGRPMAPDQEPVNQALIARGKAQILRNILQTNDIDSITPSVVAAFLREGGCDDISARKLARKLVERILEVEEKHQPMLERMAEVRPTPPATESDIRVTHIVELDLSPEEAERIVSAGRSAEVGSISPDHQMISRLVNEKIVAGEFLTGDQWDAANAMKRPNQKIESPQPVPISPRLSGPKVSEIWDAFVEERIKIGDWVNDQGVQAKSTLALLIGICGDRQLDDYKLQDGSHLRSVVLDLPSHYSKTRCWATDYKKGDFETIATAARKLKSDGDKSFTTVSPKTWNRHYSVLASLCQSASKKDGRP